MAFLDKFKNKNQPDNPPPGVNLEYSSFGVQKKENTYKPSEVTTSIRYVSKQFT